MAISSAEAISLIGNETSKILYVSPFADAESDLIATRGAESLPFQLSTVIGLATDGDLVVFLPGPYPDIADTTIFENGNVSFYACEGAVITNTSAGIFNISTAGQPFNCSGNGVFVTPGSTTMLYNADQDVNFSFKSADTIRITGASAVKTNGIVNVKYFLVNCTGEGVHTGNIASDPTVVGFDINDSVTGIAFKVYGDILGGLRSFSTGKLNIYGNINTGTSQAIAKGGTVIYPVNIYGSVIGSTIINASCTGTVEAIKVFGDITGNVTHIQGSSGITAFKISGNCYNGLLVLGQKFICEGDLIDCTVSCSTNISDVTTNNFIYKAARSVVLAIAAGKVTLLGNFIYDPLASGAQPANFITNLGTLIINGYIENTASNNDPMQPAGCIGLGNSLTRVKGNINNKSINSLSSCIQILQGTMAPGASVLYSSTATGGTSNFGTLFKYDPVSNVATKVFDFTGANGRQPLYQMVYLNGLLYGTTTGGGTSNSGSFFVFDPSSNTITSYDLGTVANVGAGIVLGSDGIFYGGTLNGEIFSFNPTTNTLAFLTAIPSGDGTQSTGLIQAANGLYYAMIDVGANGNGAVYSFNSSGNIYTKLYDFITSNGSSPVGSFAQASNGLLYGTLQNGGANGAGTLFSFDLSTNLPTILRPFSTATGSGPTGGLIQAPDGLLYGTTTGGGAFNAGVFFSYNITTATYTVIHNMAASGDAVGPRSGVILSGSKLYGVGGGGGVFSYDFTTYTFLLTATGGTQYDAAFTEIPGASQPTFRGKLILDEAVLTSNGSSIDSNFNVAVKSYGAHTNKPTSGTGTYTYPVDALITNPFVE